ncbi:MAG: CopD family protein [Xanthobacteraceae bacterium]|nr:CopD family protein [Xanthobacteraceae bacterium]
MLMIGVAFHIVAAVIWVGGMFFALTVLRPSTGPLDPPTRLALWQRVFARFFPWVWGAVAVLLVSGFAMVIWGFGGFAKIGTYVHLMMGLGIVMMLIYAHLYFAPWRRFRRAVAAGEWPIAAKYIDQIRLLVTINLVLGLITVVVGAAGRYYG